MAVYLSAVISSIMVSGVAPILRHLEGMVSSCIQPQGWPPSYCLDQKWQDARIPLVDEGPFLRLRRMFSSEAGKRVASQAPIVSKLSPHRLAKSIQVNVSDVYRFTSRIKASQARHTMAYTVSPRQVKASQTRDTAAHSVPHRARAGAMIPPHLEGGRGHHTSRPPWQEMFLPRIRSYARWSAVSSHYR
jgi:hypothetical protein